MKFRNCAYVEHGPVDVLSRPGGRVVWLHRDIKTTQCPKSIISSESGVLLEQFAIWKRTGGGLWDLDAKTAEAILILEEEWQAERQYVEAEAKLTEN